MPAFAGHTTGCADFPLPVPRGRASRPVQLSAAVSWTGLRDPKFSPCCPSAVLSSRRPPSLDRVPARLVPRRRRYYEGATTSHSRIPGQLFVSLPGPTRSSSVRVRRYQRSRAAGGPPQAKIFVQPVISTCRRTFTWTRVGPLRFPDDPSCASAPFQDPGRTDAPSPITVASGAAPAVTKAKAPACH
jgi:hypothetical protein